MEMFHQAWHLLVRAFIAMPSRISGNWFAVVFGVFVFCIKPFIDFCKNGWQAMKANWWSTVKEALLISAISWSGLLLFSAADEVYHTHNDEVARWRSVVNEKNGLKLAGAQQESYIRSVEHARAVSTESLKPLTPYVSSFTKELPMPAFASQGLPTTEA
jgi:hypothetical protein